MSTKRSALEHKYNKVNQQKKFHLLSLIYKHRLNVKEAAQHVGINYLTAKTIVFFHKNNYHSYQFHILNQHQINNNPLTASYTNIRKFNPTEQPTKNKSRIQVICSIANILNPLSSKIQNLPQQKHPHIQGREMELQNLVLEEAIEEAILFDKNMSPSRSHTSDLNNLNCWGVGDVSVKGGVKLKAGQYLGLVGKSHMNMGHP